MIWALRHLQILAGYAFLGLGIAGILLPVLPGTVFLIIALACFRRTLPHMNVWMLNHKLFGPILQVWDKTGSIPVPVKVLAVSCILLMGGSSAYRAHVQWAQVLLAVVTVVGVVYVVTRPNSAPGIYREARRRMAA